MSTDIRNIRRSNPDGMKGHTDVTRGTENEKGGISALIGRRKFLALGGAGAAVLVGTAGAARALITAGGPAATPRSLNPVGLDPETGRSSDAIAAAPLGVRHFALAGTDGWVSFPSAAKVGDTLGAKSIDPYFPDPLADRDNKTTYAFCFRNVTALNQSQVAAQKGRTQICAPIFYSTVGEELWVTLNNLGLQLRPDLVDGHTLHWHGFRNAIPFYDGVPESSIAVPIGREFTYVYRPADSGTYMYHCHFEDVEHVTMGMHGIVFVKPDPADTIGIGTDPGQHAEKAYGLADGDTTGETGFDREYAIMLSEVDTRAHFGDAHIQATDWTDFHPDFWTMNGRAYPDTLEPNGTRDTEGQLFAQSWDGTYVGGAPHLTKIADIDAPESRLFSNPLSSLVQAAPGERILIRFANLGFLDHTIVFPGLEIDVLGRDSRYVPPSAQRTSTDSIQIGPGESRDVFFTAPDEGTYAFYDRGLSHYTGSADGTDSWVGGQRSEVRVIPGLAAQAKPNGWAGEAAWHGEFPLASQHNPPAIAAAGHRITTGPQAGRGKFLDGTVTVDFANNPGTYLSKLWWVRKDSPAPALPGSGGDSNLWQSAVFTSGEPTNAFHIRVAGQNPAATSHYYLLAQDSAGAFSSAVSANI
jgi:FtsP/CotA-like multicopper oxidase with cupredoxin domain